MCESMAALAIAPAHNSDEALKKLRAFMLWRDDDGLEVLEDAATDDKLMFSVLRDMSAALSPKAPQEPNVSGVNLG